MATLLVYRCPQSGMMTQTWLSAGSIAGDHETYEPVTCLACSKQHFICLATGHVLGEDEARTNSARPVPVFPPKQIRRLHERVTPATPSDRLPGESPVVRAATDLPKAC